MLSETTTAVAPATLLEIRDGRLLLQLPERQAWASLALAFPYSPEIGDVLLAIGDEDVYVIGVLAGRGKTLLKTQGELELAAEHITIRAEQGVKIKGVNVEIEADKLEFAARAVFERFVDAYRWAKGVVQNSAARVRTLVTGAYTVQAETIVEQAEKDVKIDGRHIHLG
ncbi:MAG TPA: DUF3540 domain-containing protein [Planctomycetota bacterium]|nr:DUF3540 domain-containing protein [Planctomycetota bacterium]